jgi:hypothetical protein
VRCTRDDLKTRALPPLRAAAAHIARALGAGNGNGIGFSL